MPAIEVSDLRKIYHGVPAVDNISFEVHEGEVFGLLGPNGAGKTTTVECIEGLRVPDGGKITVLGHEHLNNGNGIKERIGIQLQTTGLYPLLTVTDPEHMKKTLATNSLPDFTGAVRLAAKASGIETNEIGFYSCVHIAPKAHYAIMDALGIDRANTVYLCDDGHCGHADPLIAHKYGLERGLIKDGTLCAWEAAGTGYAFACSIVRWGKVKN